MKQSILILVILAFSISASYSQVETRFFERNAKASIKHLSSAKVDKSKIISLPSQEISMKLSQYAVLDSFEEDRFGVPVDVSYSLNNGEWVKTDDGRVWSLGFKSNNATSLTFFFSNLYLPDGAELYIINSDETICYGPVTHDALTEKGHYLTHIIPCSEATIYLYEPTKAYGQSVLDLSRIIHGSNIFEKTHVNASTGVKTITYPQSVACYPSWTNTSDGVGTIIFSDGTYASGALLMTTSYNFEPYLLFNLRSVHTSSDSILTSLEIAKIVSMAVTFRAREISCGSSTQMTNYTYNGVFLSAYWHETKFALVNILQDVKQQKNITWLGWDISGSTPSQGTWIGKYGSIYSALSYTVDGISTSENPFTHKNEWNAVESWYTEHVTTKGSPLFNPSKEVIGFLSDNYCYGDGYYRYWFSKFSDSWTGGGQNNNRLSNRLDPGNKGFTSVNSCHPLTIEGPTSATGSAVYYIDNLPSDFTVQWYFPQNQYCNQHCLYENTPASNQCTVTPDSQHNMTEITLRAFLYRGSTFVTCMDKTITVNYSRQDFGNPIDNGSKYLQVSNDNNNIYVKILDNNSNNQSVYTIEGYDATTYSKIFSKETMNKFCTINATSWKPGVYIIRIIIDGKTYSRKFLKK